MGFRINSIKRKTNKLRSKTRSKTRPRRISNMKSAPSNRFHFLTNVKRVSPLQFLENAISKVLALKHKN
jgi:hypothetical protein